MPDKSADPSAPAIILEYDVVTDGSLFVEGHYERIKILSQEGRRYANVEIPYYARVGKVAGIRARVTSPDGVSTEFNGTIYDNESIRTKKYQIRTKSFALPNVQVGSIIEYAYQLSDYHYLPMYFIDPAKYILHGTYSASAADWTVQQDLFVRHASFSLIPSRYGMHMTTYLHGVPRDALQRNPKTNVIQLEMNDVPAFQAEEYSGPQGNLRMCADLFYTMGPTDPYQIFWVSLAKREGKALEELTAKTKIVEREAASLLQPGDTPEATLRRIYARVQKIRNLSYETDKTKQERKEENIKENKSAEDVLNHGYGYYPELNYTFVALARAAGFQAQLVRIATRDQFLFTPQRFDANQLTADIVQVRLPASVLYLDPGTVFCPFGFLPWSETGVQGIRLDPADGALLEAPTPAVSGTSTRRLANLKLDEEGNLLGEVTLTMDGQLALAARIDALELDDPQRQKYLEDLLAPSLPPGAAIKTISTDGWKEENAPLEGKFEISVPNFATIAGKRMIFPLGIVRSNIAAKFTSTTRTNPVYFDNAFEFSDEVYLELPANYTVESLPPPQTARSSTNEYMLRGELMGKMLHFERTLKQSQYLFGPQQYFMLRTFYGAARTGDEQQITLKPAPPPAAP